MGFVALIVSLVSLITSGVTMCVVIKNKRRDSHEVTQDYIEPLPPPGYGGGLKKTMWDDEGN